MLDGKFRKTEMTSIFLINMEETFKLLLLFIAIYLLNSFLVFVYKKEKKA